MKTSDVVSSSKSKIVPALKHHHVCSIHTCHNSACECTQIPVLSLAKVTLEYRIWVGGVRIMQLQSAI